MNRVSFYLLVSLVAGSCNQTYKVTTDSMSNTFNTGQVLELKKTASVNRGDVVFFVNNISSNQRKETWIFRVAAYSGDTLELKDGALRINGNITELPANARLLYSITASRPLDMKGFRENTLRQLNDSSYIAHLTSDEYNKISKLPDVTAISRIISSPGNHAKGIVRSDFTDNWNEDQFGPLYIPSVGVKIKISQTNKGLYSDILADLQPDSTVTIKEKLYFLLGDNRSNAFDSRFIGLIKESSIIGCAEEK